MMNTLIWCLQRTAAMVASILLKLLITVKGLNFTRTLWCRESIILPTFQMRNCSIKRQYYLPQVIHIVCGKNRNLIQSLGRDLTTSSFSFSSSVSQDSTPEKFLGKGAKQYWRRHANRNSVELVQKKMLLNANVASSHIYTENFCRNIILVW